MEKTEIFLTTSTAEIFNSITDKPIEGVLIVNSITFDDISNDFPTLLLAFSSSVAINIFSNWLYDRLKNGNGVEARINGQPATVDSTAIEIIISQSKNISVNIKISNLAQDTLPKEITIKQNPNPAVHTDAVQ